MKKTLIPVVLASIALVGCNEVTETASDVAKEVAVTAKTEVVASVEETGFLSEIKQYKESISELIQMDISIPEQAKKVEDQLTNMYVCIKESTTENFADKFISTVSDSIKDPSMGDLLDRAIDKASSAAECTM